MSWCIALTDTAQWETVLWHKPSVNNSANLMRKWSEILLKTRILMLSNQFFFFATCSVCTYFFHLRLPNSGKSWVLVQTLFTCCRNKRLRTTQTTRKPFTAFLFFVLISSQLYSQLHFCFWGEVCSLPFFLLLFWSFFLLCALLWSRLDRFSTKNALTCDTCDSKKYNSLFSQAYIRMRVWRWGCDIGYKKNCIALWGTMQDKEKSAR